MGFIIKKEKYCSTKGITDQGKIKDKFVVEHGVKYTLLGFIKWKRVEQYFIKIKNKSYEK